MKRIVPLVLFVSLAVSVPGCSDSPRGKSDLPPGAKSDIGQPTVVGSGGPKPAGGNPKGKPTGVGVD